MTQEKSLRLPHRDVDVGRGDKAVRALTTMDSVALTVGTMVGAGIFSVLALTVRTAGFASVFSWALDVILSLPMAASFSDLTGVLSQSGGPYVYVRDRVHRTLGYMVGWSFLLSALGASAALLMALAGMIGQLGIAHAELWADVFLLGLAMVISFGIHVGARVQRALTVGTLLLLVLCVGIGFAHARWLPDVNLHHLAQGLPSKHVHALVAAIFPHGVFAVGLGTFYAFWTYSGWEAVTVPSASYRSPKALGVGMMVGSVVVGVAYVLVALSAVLSVPSRLLGSEMNPLVLVGDLWGPWAGRLVALGALVVVVGSLLSWLIASTALIQSLAKDGFLPAPRVIRMAKGEFHAGLPWVVALLLIGISTLHVFAAAIAASSLTALIPYALVFAVVALHPDASWTGFFKSSQTRRFVAGMALVVSILFIVWGGWSNLWPTVVLLGIGALWLGLQHATRMGVYR